jgi:hypothetical protein
MFHGVSGALLAKVLFAGHFLAVTFANETGRQFIDTNTDNNVTEGPRLNSRYKAGVVQLSRDPIRPRCNSITAKSGRFVSLSSHLSAPSQHFQIFQSRQVDPDERR